jgi:hypothetical protein
MEREPPPLYIKLQQGPSVLFLGQNYLSLETSIDPLLTEIIRKFGSNENASGYSKILNNDAFKSPEAMESGITWMRKRCTQIPTPEWLNIVAAFPWNSVLTSAFDSIWLNLFRSEWRELQPLYDDKYTPLNIRNQFKLHCTCLFGNVNGHDESSRPPLTKQQLARRRLVALNLAQRIPDIITPFGVLVIEGYEGNQDWLNLDELLSVLHNLSVGQVHIFSCSTGLKKDPDVQEEVRAGKIVLHDESLASYLLWARNEGRLQLGAPPDSKEHNRRIRIRESVLYVPSELWNEVITFATIIDDSTIAPPPSLATQSDIYREFRNFLSESSNKVVWSGYSRGFAFHRNFEDELHKKVNDKLQSSKSHTRPIVVHGQTGTGKTIALGSIAYRTRIEGRYPVLYINHGTQRNIRAKLDSFCEWVENNSAGQTLIVWDGMLDVDEYYKLLQFLASKGRKAVLVGSSYNLPETNLKKVDLVSAPSELSSVEIQRFEKFLDKIDPEISVMAKERMEIKNSYFLVALYRFLPDTRDGLGKGVQKEVGRTEENILKMLRRSNYREKFSTALGIALLKSNSEYIKALTTFEGATEIEGEDVSQLQALIGLIMVPGRLNLSVPIDLLLRSLNKIDIVNFVDVLKRFDIFRWATDQTGNITISPRNSTEATLLVQARLGKASTEVAYATQLIRAIKCSEEISENPELQFAIDLVRSMGPNGRNPDYYANEYLNLSASLEFLREEQSVLNPRLMLQEALLVREFVKENDAVKKSPDTGQLLLDKAEKVIRDALDLVLVDNRRRQLRSVLLVELSSILGTKILHMIRQKQLFTEIWPIYQEARRKLFEARANDPQNYYQVDVMSWIVIALLEYDKNHVMDSGTRAEIEADILHVFEMGETEDYGPKQLEMFNSKREIIGYLLNRQDISDDAFAALLAKGSGAGFYLRAARMANVRALPRKGDLGSEQLEDCLTGVRYLEENIDHIIQDGRCLYLLLRLWWMSEVGKPMFSTFREAVPFSDEQWELLLSHITNLSNAGEEFIKPTIKYLKGLAHFHLRHYQTAFDIFKELEKDREVQSIRRLSLSYVLSTPDGRAQAFYGIATKVTQDGRKGWVYLPEVDREIPFNPRDFNKPEMREGEALNNFRIAFNFIGPIADPDKHYRA